MDVSMAASERNDAMAVLRDNQHEHYRAHTG
jgi:hypothetical protein